MSAERGPVGKPFRRQRFWQRETERRYFLLSREAVDVLERFKEAFGGRGMLADVALRDGFDNLPVIEDGHTDIVSKPLRVSTAYSARSVEELSVVLNASLCDYGRKRYEPARAPAAREHMVFEIPRVFLRTQIRRAFHDRRDIDLDKDLRLEAVLHGLAKQLEQSSTDSVTASVDEQLYYQVEAKAIEAELDLDTLIAWEFARQLL